MLHVFSIKWASCGSKLSANSRQTIGKLSVGILCVSLEVGLHPLVCPEAPLPMRSDGILAAFGHIKKLILSRGRERERERAIEGERGEGGEREGRGGEERGEEGRGGEERRGEERIEERGQRERDEQQT